MNKLTADKLRDFTNDPANIKIMEALFMAIAFEQTITEIVNKKQDEVISFYKFKVRDEFSERLGQECVTNHKDAYLMSDEDFEIYHKEMQAFYHSDACPVKPRGKDYCPALEAQSAVRELKRTIADVFEPVLGIGSDTLCRNLKYYNQYFDLIMTLFAPKMKSPINL
jgi:hypothetical protein